MHEKSTLIDPAASSRRLPHKSVHAIRSSHRPLISLSEDETNKPSQDEPLLPSTVQRSDSPVLENNRAHACRLVYRPYLPKHKNDLFDSSGLGIVVQHHTKNHLLSVQASETICEYSCIPFHLLILYIGLHTKPQQPSSKGNLCSFRTSKRFGESYATST